MTVGVQGMPIADVSVGSFGIHFQPRISYDKAYLAVSCPNGQVFYKSFPAGASPYLSLSDSKANFSDGVYTYELKLVPYFAKKVRKDEKLSVIPQQAMVLSGYFTVQGGSILPMGIPEGGPARPQDVLHYDDVIITGSLCVGFDCADGESFGFCTVKLKENNVQICFEDTSTGTFPTNDWKIQTNDSASGGASYFTIWDTDAGVRPFTIEAGADANALYVDDTGRVGLRTATPVLDLHIVDGDTPDFRLEQDGSSGWTAQTWDIAGNESNFFIRDVTGGSKLPFRIQPGTPTNTLTLRADGAVGMGTWAPAFPLEIERTGADVTLVAERTDGAIAQMSARSDKTMFGSRSNHKLNLCTNNDPKVTVTTDGYVGVGTVTPTHKLEVYNGAGANAYCDGGNWVNGSSRAFKENIKDLSTADALNTLNELNPVRFNYREMDEEYLGFIAEDVPELVAMKDRKGMSPMDVVAVLTKVVQEQQKTISELQQKISEIEKK
jgi:hypothetical protein